jgi:hypothetical protein
MKEQPASRQHQIFGSLLNPDERDPTLRPDE